jgi:hypothetical protein
MTRAPATFPDPEGVEDLDCRCSAEPSGDATLTPNELIRQADEKLLNRLTAMMTKLASLTSMSGRRVHRGGMQIALP